MADESTCMTRLGAIEATAMRKLTMKNSLYDNLQHCNQQEQSPLYSKLPKELRDLIYELATAEYDDKDNLYPKTAFHYRPGYKAPKKSCSNLLRTCRRIWLETSSLPMKQAVFTFWLSSQRGPPQQQTATLHTQWPKIRDNFTALNLQNLTTIKFFLQSYEAYRRFHLNSVEEAIFDTLSPKILRITIRHTDWYWWENDAPLGLEDHWIQRILDAPYMDSVEEFLLELETLERNKEQLQPIVDRIARLQGVVRKSQSGEPVYFKLDSVLDPWHWAGPTNIGGKVEEVYRNLKQLDYRVVTVRWKTSKPTSCAAPDTIPQVSKLDQRMTHIFPTMLGNQRPFGVGALRFAQHMRRSNLNRDGWHRCRFPFANVILRQYSDCIARNTEDEMRWRFEKMFADIQAKRLEAEWQSQGSLLCFGNVIHPRSAPQSQS